MMDPKQLMDFTQREYTVLQEEKVNFPLITKNLKQVLLV